MVLWGANSDGEHHNKGRVMTEWLASLVPGQVATYSRTIRDADVALFALITGDQHPLHLDQHYAATTHFGRRVVPVTLISGVIEAALAATIPGMQGMVRCQSLEYPAPLFVDEAITVTIEHCGTNVVEARIMCHVTATSEAGVVVASGDTYLTIAQLPEMPPE